MGTEIVLCCFEIAVEVACLDDAGPFWQAEITSRRAAYISAKLNPWKYSYRSSFIKRATFGNPCVSTRGGKSLPFGA